MTWIMSAATISAMWLAGNKNPWGWGISVLNQVLWSAWIIHSGEWGLAPMNAAMWFVSVRNLLRWTRA